MGVANPPPPPPFKPECVNFNSSLLAKLILWEYRCHTLLVIACTLPITSAEAERSFSLMRRLKTALRSTMAEEHLSDLAVIAIHYGEKVTTDDICRTFESLSPVTVEVS